MAFCTNVLVVNGVEVGVYHLHAFVTPDISDHASDMGFDIYSVGDKIEYFTTYGINTTFYCSVTGRTHMVRYKLLSVGYKLYLCSYVHKHRVYPVSDESKESAYPSADENKAFMWWCESHGILERPVFMTLIDNY